MKRRPSKSARIILYAFGGIAALACSGSPDGESNTEGDPASTADPTGKTGKLEITNEGTVETGVFQTPYGKQTLTYLRRHDGTRIFEGDIVLPEEGLEYRSGGVTAIGSLWSNGIVPFENSGLSGDPRVTAAIQHWQQQLPLTFVGGATSGPRLRFVASTVCNSALGRVDDVNGQVINLAPGCGTGETIHEIGHALGLWHEQSRTDRNTFVSINWGCIQAGKASNFNAFGSSGINLGPYDLGSVMHYGSNFFLDSTIPGCTATITTAAGGTIVPNTTGLSNLDIAGVRALYQAWSPRTPADYDYDGAADFAIWRPTEGGATGVWHVVPSGGGAHDRQEWGLPNDVPVPGDYNGDGLADRAVWRPSNGTWYIKFAEGWTREVQWGTAGDIPVPADYDGDSRIDTAVWRPSEGNWYIIESNSQQHVIQQLGSANHIPVPRDFDGDGRADRAIFSGGGWLVVGTSTGFGWTEFGTTGDIPVPNDYDGDGSIDIAVWRPSNGTWYIRRPDGGTTERQWGLPGDVPVPARYDYDGATDIAVWRPSNGTWYVQFSSFGNFPFESQWGLPGDAAAP